VSRLQRHFFLNLVPCLPLALLYLTGIQAGLNLHLVALLLPLRGIVITFAKCPCASGEPACNFCSYPAMKAE
jgi:hypothetical protein